MNYITGLELFYMFDLALQNTRTTLLNLDWIYLFMKYIALRLEKHSAQGLGLILLNTGLELINQPNRNVVTKVWRLSWMNCFLPFNIRLIHAAFTVPSIGNLCMTSPFTLLDFLFSSGYGISLLHMLMTHLDCFHIL